MSRNSLLYLRILSQNKVKLGRNSLKVGKCFNFLTNWSMSITPEIHGSYNWYSLRHGEEIVTRKPWYQFVDQKEAQDMFKIVETLKEAGLKGQKVV